MKGNCYLLGGGSPALKKLSIVTPCYFNEDNLRDTYSEVRRTVFNVCDEYDWEWVLVDDGSKDQTFLVASQLQQEDSRIKIVKLSRNFGEFRAIVAGLSVAEGEAIAVISADLQDPPETVCEMYEKLSSGEYDCVATCRTTRAGEPIIRSVFAKLFYRLINLVSDVEIVDGALDYRMMTRKMVENILRLSEYNRFSKGLFQWVGGKTYWLPYQNVERAAGSTKWSFRKL